MTEKDITFYEIEYYLPKHESASSNTNGRRRYDKRIAWFSPFTGEVKANNDHIKGLIERFQDTL